MDDSEALMINGEQENGDEFYEKIEAPKFVDLTAPDCYYPGDDRSWFCLRVGCEQNHDEEMDSEKIYNNFVLQVMAARSPNIRLRKALYKKNSIERNCPQTVPAKPSKSRVTRMALISSISKRLVDPKVKVKPLSKQKATPNAKGKQASVIAKALTTPRSKKQLANPDAFRSVRNPKTAVTAVPSNNRIVAKALVFHSPKKAAKTKSSVELNTPLKTLCAGMKKLEINKQVCDASRKKLRGRKVKSRVFDGLKDAKSSKCLKIDKRENNLQQNHDLVSREKVEKDVSESEIEQKTRITRGVCSASMSDDGNSPEPLDVDIKSEALSDANARDSNSMFESGKENSIDDDNVSQPLGENDDKRKKLNSDDDKENDSEAMESDDKENASASDGNRESDVKMSHVEHKIIGKHEISKGSQKTKAKSKQVKESTNSAATGAQGLKIRKPKPTNPKPFRLRTDERGILKEANMEKKLHHTPLSEITWVTKVAGGNMPKRHQNVTQRNEKCVEQNENQSDTNEEIDKETKIAKEKAGQKMSSTPQRHTISSQQKLVALQQDKSTPKTANSSTRTKSPYLRQLSTPQEAASSRAKTGQLGTIKETSPTILRAKTATKPAKNGVSVTTKASVSPASRRFTTIPKEPNFHTIHMPKSCTRKVA